MLRKLSAVLLTTALLTSGAAVGSAAGAAKPVQQASVAKKINVLFNGKPLVFPQEPTSFNGVVYVNASTLALTLGGSAAWDSTSKSVKIAKGDNYALRIFADSSFAYKNGKKVTVPGVAKPVTGAVLVPLVFITQELGAKITFDAKTNTYSITLKV